MIQILLTILMLFYAPTDSFENRVCNCLATNFEQAGMNYEGILDSIELDFISHGVNDHKQLLNDISSKGIVDVKRGYDNIPFEQVGRTTLHYCIKLHTYSDPNGTANDAYHLVRKLDAYRQSNPKPTFSDLSKAIAEITIENPLSQYPKLNRFVQLTTIYNLTRHKDDPSFLKLPPWNKSQKPIGETVKVLVLPGDIIQVKDKVTAVEDLCETLQPHLKNKRSIKLGTRRKTRYQTYVTVYDRLKQCIKDMREEYARATYGMSYNDLTEVEQKDVCNHIAVEIVEDEPN